MAISLALPWASWSDKTLLKTSSASPAATPSVSPGLVLTLTTPPTLVVLNAPRAPAQGAFSFLRPADVTAPLFPALEVREQGCPVVQPVVFSRARLVSRALKLLEGEMRPTGCTRCCAVSATTSAGCCARSPRRDWPSCGRFIVLILRGLVGMPRKWGEFVAQVIKLVNRPSKLGALAQ